MFSIYGLLIEKLKCVHLGGPSALRSEPGVSAARRAAWLPGQICLLAVCTQTSAHPDGTSSPPFSGPKSVFQGLGEVKPV